MSDSAAVLNTGDQGQAYYSGTGGREYSGSGAGQNTRIQSQAINGRTLGNSDQLQRRTNLEGSQSVKNNGPNDSSEDLDLNNDYNDQVEQSGSRAPNASGNGIDLDDIAKNGANLSGKDEGNGLLGATLIDKISRNDQYTNQGKNSERKRASTYREAVSDADAGSENDEMIAENQKPRQSEPRKSSSSRGRRKEFLDLAEDPAEETEASRKANGSGRTSNSDKSKSNGWPQAGSISSRQSTESRRTRLSSTSDDNKDDDTDLAEIEPGENTYSINYAPENIFIETNS